MDNLNTITYADDWKEAYTPVYKEEEDYTPQEENTVVKKAKQHNLPLLITIQLILCLLILASAFVIKTIGGDFYQSVRKWYYNNLNDEIIITESFETFDLDDIFGNEF